MIPKRQISKKREAINNKEYAIFMEANHFVVAVYRDHWNRISRIETSDRKVAVEEAEKDSRALLSATTEAGRHVTFGYESFVKLRELVERENNADLQGSGDVTVHGDNADSNQRVNRVSKPRRAGY